MIFLPKKIFWHSRVLLPTMFIYIIYKDVVPYIIDSILPFFYLYKEVLWKKLKNWRGILNLYFPISVKNK